MTLVAPRHRLDPTSRQGLASRRPRWRWRRAATATLLGLLIHAPTATAQRTSVDAEEELPTAVVQEITTRLNDAATEVRRGDVVIPAGAVQMGDLAVVDGDLTLGGRVEGDLFVVNGSLSFGSDAEVGGDVLVVGGTTQNQAARLGGELAVHSAIYAYERVGGEYRYLGSTDAVALQQDRDPRGTADFLITTGRSYNRVEGLPIAFGPRLQTESSNPFRLEALAIYRTESGLTLDPERMGYFVRADQHVAGRREFRLGATLHSLVDPIEDWHLSDLETGLATFVIHRDYRDHYERQGWSVFATWEPRTLPVLLQVEGRWDRHSVLQVGNPWSLFRNAESWRAQPVVAEGRLASIVLQGEYDSRSSDWNPASGWLIRGQLEQAVDSDLAYPSVIAVDPALELAIPTYGRFLTGLVDMRSYNRIDADSRLNLRLVAGGSFKGDPLPPQRQHALGGEGSLPGFDLFSKDCGARGAPVRLGRDGAASDETPFFANYGCDAIALLQAEFRGKLAFRFRWGGGPWRNGRNEGDEDDGWAIGWDMAPDWSLFVDAGRGWSFDDRPDEETHVNVGGGILLERIGVYFAVPVTGGSGVKFFVRLGPRF